MLRADSTFARPFLFLLCVIVVLLVASTPASAENAEGTVADGAVGAGLEENRENIWGGGGGDDDYPGARPQLPPMYTTTRATDSPWAYDCTGAGCRASRQACAGGVDFELTGGDVVANPVPSANQSAAPDMVTVERVRVDTISGTEEHLGYDCVAAGEVGGVAAEPIVITVTQRDFQSMPVAPLVAHAGPADGWLPVNMVNVLHAESAEQTLEVTLLGTPVAVRAIPVSYHWDLGDGNTVTTTHPGEAFPSERVSATYAQEGWYDVQLTTTFRGEFAVAGGPWQPIDGTIEVASEPTSLFSKSLESRLVDGDVPVDENGDPWIPERTPDTEGPQDPAAEHRTIS